MRLARLQPEQTPPSQDPKFYAEIFELMEQVRPSRVPCPVCGHVDFAGFICEMCGNNPSIDNLVLC